VPPEPRFEESALKWRDPDDIARHPELPRMSGEGFESLYNEVKHEQESFEIPHRRSAAMSPRSPRASRRLGAGTDRSAGGGPAADPGAAPRGAS